MTTVITTTMTLRIILSVRGPLYYGGSFSGQGSTTTGTHSVSRGGIGSGRLPPNAPSILQINSHAHSAHTYTIDGISQKVEHGWDGIEGKADVLPLPHDKGSSMHDPRRC